MKPLILLLALQTALLAAPSDPTFTNPKIKGLSAGADSNTNIIKVDATTGALTRVTIPATDLTGYLLSATASSTYAPLSGATFTGPVIIGPGGISIPTGESIFLDAGSSFECINGAVFNYGAGSAAAHRTALGMGNAALLTVDTDLATFVLPASTTISAFGATLTDDADAATARTTLGLGTLATQSGTFSGTNTGDQTSIAGIAGTMAQFDTAASDGNFVFQSTAPTLTGTNFSGTSTALSIGGNAATVTTNANLTGHITSTGNAAVLGSFTLAQLNAAINDADVATGGGTATGTNTGDNATNSQYSGLVTNATHTGDATGATALTVVKINGTLMSGLATGILKNTNGTGVPSIATAGTDYYNPGGTDVAVADGGTGSSTAAGAATNLGLGTGDSPAWLPLALSIATAAPNATNNVANYKVPATSGTTRTDVSIQGRGTGAFLVGPVPDSAATGGNVRGASSADLQSSRSSAAQVASGTAAFAAGNANTVSGNYSGGIGNTNTVSGSSAFAAGETNGVAGNYGGSIGLNNSSGGASSMTFGNTAYAPAAYAQARGFQSYSLRIGQDTFANGQFSALGDAQAGRCFLRFLTTNATQTELSLNGSAVSGTSISTATRFIIQASTVVHCDVYITACETSSGNRAAYHRSCVISRNGSNNTALAGLTTVGSDYESNAAWDVTLASDDTNESLQILVTGVVSTNIRWFARVEFNELTSP